MKAFLTALLMTIATVAYSATVDIHTDDYESIYYSGMMSHGMHGYSSPIGGPNTGYGSFYVGQKAGDDRLINDETDGEYGYQAVMSFRITTANVPTGTPITDVKLGINIQDCQFPKGAQLWIYPLKKSRSDGNLIMPSWTFASYTLAQKWANVDAGQADNWLLAHTSPVDVYPGKGVITSTQLNGNPNDFTYYEIDVDSVFSGFVPSEGRGDPIDVSFLIMSGDNNSLVYCSNFNQGRNDPVYLRITYGGNEVPTATFTPTPPAGRTPTFTPTVATPTPTNTATVTATPTNTGITPTATPTFTGISPTPTNTITKTFTPTPTSTSTLSPTVTVTRTPTVGSTQTFTPSHTLTPTFTVTPTRTITPTGTAGSTPTWTATWTATRSMTPTKTNTPVGAPTQPYDKLLVSGPEGYPMSATTGYIDTLEVANLTVKNLTAESGVISSDELYLEGGISVTRLGFTCGPEARWNIGGYLNIDNDTFITKDGLLQLTKESAPPYLSNSWDAANGILNLYSSGRTGTLNLGYGTGGFTLGGYYTTEGTIGFGTDDYITLDVTDSAVEFNETNTSLRADSPELHFGAEQGGTGKGEAYIKWDTTTNTFNIGDYTYPTPGAVNAVTIDTDDNSVTIAGNLTVSGTLYGVEPVSIINASQVTAGTFGDGSYTFQDNLTFSGTDPQLIFPNSDAIRYTNSTAVLDIYNGAEALLSIDVDGGYAGIGAINELYKFDVLNAGSSGPDWAIFGNNTSTEETNAVGVGGSATGVHTTGVNIGLYGNVSGSTAGNRGSSMTVTGSVGSVNYGVYAANICTSAGSKYGGRFDSTGANGNNYGVYTLASGGTANWDLYTAGTQSRIAGMLQLTDTGQQITVDTSANQFLFGNSTTANMLSIDTDTGAVIATGGLTIGGSLNPGTDFSVTGQLLWYDGTNIVGLASVGASGEVLKSQGAGQPPIFEAVSGAHDAVTVGGSYDYITLSGQVLTRGQVDLTTDITGVLPDANVATTLARDSEVPSLITGGASTVASTDLTVSRALASNASGKIAASAVTSTELGYLSGVTSAVQTQIDAKLSALTGSGSTIDTESLTASRVIETNGSGKLAASGITTTELGYLSGVTSNVQTQISGRALTSHNHAGSQITSGVVDEAYIDSDIARDSEVSGLFSLTANRALISSALGAITYSAVTATELGYLTGVTSAVQTQLNSKQATITGSATTVDTETLTASMAVETDASGKLAASSSISSTELGYLNGVSSAVQTQLNAKQATITGSATTVDTETLGSSLAMATDASGKIGVSAVSSTELSYLDGVTSAVQTQLNSKQATITGSATSIDTETLTINRAVATDGSGKIAVSAVTATELGYLSGVTSALQTQLAAKQATITGSATTVDTETLTGNLALITNSSGLIATSAVSSTELSYLDGVTSAVQTQIDAKQATITGSATTVDTETLGNSLALMTNASGKIATSAVTATELGYLSGVSSAVQTQLNAKQPTITGSATTVDTETLTASMAMATDSNGKVATSAVTSTELGYLDGVTSALQTQLAAKQATLTGSANQTLRFSGTDAVTASSVLTNDGTNLVTSGNLTMGNGKVLTNEIIKAVDSSGVAIQDTDGNPVITALTSVAVPTTSMVVFRDSSQTMTIDTTQNTISFGTSTIPKVIIDSDDGNLTMVTGSKLITETIQSIDGTGIPVVDKSGNAIVTFADDNTSTFAGAVTINDDLTTTGRAAVGSSTDRITWYQPASDGTGGGTVAWVSGADSSIYDRWTQTGPDGGTVTFPCPMCTPGTVVYSVKTICEAANGDQVFEIGVYSSKTTSPGTVEGVVGLSTCTTGSGLVNITGNYYYHLDTGTNLPYTVTAGEKLWCSVTLLPTAGNTAVLHGVEWTFEKVQY